MRLAFWHSGRSAANCPAATWMSLPVATARRGLGDGVPCSPACLTWANARPLGDSSSPRVGGGKVCGASSLAGAVSGCLSALVRPIESTAVRWMQANPSRPVAAQETCSRVAKPGTPGRMEVPWACLPSLARPTACTRTRYRGVLQEASFDAAVGRSDRIRSASMATGPLHFGAGRRPNQRRAARSAHLHCR